MNIPIDPTKSLSFPCGDSTAAQTALSAIAAPVAAGAATVATGVGSAVAATASAVGGAVIGTAEAIGTVMIAAAPIAVPLVVVGSAIYGLKKFLDA